MIYTSRFSNPELASGKYMVVGVVRSLPKFQLRYQLAGNIIEIAPPGFLFNENDREKFTGRYKQNIETTVGVDKTANILNSYARQGKDIVLCCFEDVRQPKEWCHRLVFAEWWLEKTGEIITELVDTSNVKLKNGKYVKFDEIDKYNADGTLKQLNTQQVKFDKPVCEQLQLFSF